MTMQAVASSNIRTVGYDHVTKVLTLQFHSGLVYDFDEVPPQVHHELMNSDSKGRFFNKYIRNEFTTTRRA